MAVNETVGINLVADTKSLRSQLKEAVAELANLQNKAGASAKEIANAAKRAAELKDRIGDAKATIDAFNPDAKFKAFGQSIAGVAGAFSAAQGAFALFGVESENVQKQLLKVQAALAFSEGLNTILGSIDGFKNLALVIKTQVLSAFTTLRGAIIATGIGALAVGLGLLIANFDAIKRAVLNAVPGLQTVANVIGNIVEKITDFVGITSQTDRALELFAKNSANRKATYERELKVLEAQGASEKQLSELRKKIAQEDINTLKAKQRNGKELSEDEKKLLSDTYNEQRIIIAKGEKDASDAKLEARKKFLEADKAAQDEIDAERRKKIDGYEKEDQDRFEKRITDARKIPSILGKIEDQTEKNQMLRMNRIQKQIGEFKATEVKITELTEETKLGIIGNAVGAAANLIGRNTAAGKALSIAQATIDTYAGATKAFAAYPPPFGAIAAGTVIAGGLASVAAIVKTNVPGFDSGGFSAPSASAPIVPRFTPPSPTDLSAASLNTINNVVSRAYVVESDITGSQKRIRRIENAARI